MIAAQSADLEVRPLTGYTGAEMVGVDLSQPLDDRAVAAIGEELARWKVVVFRGQALDHDAHLRFVRHFGSTITFVADGGPAAEHHAEIEEVVYRYPPITEDAPPHIQNWHLDGLNSLMPPSHISLRAEVVRPYGGDTHFSNLVAAYEGLPAEIRTFADGARSVNRFPAYLTRGNLDLLRQVEANPVVTEHPVVRVHPVTGERGLYVEPTHTVEIVGLTPRQSRYMLDLFFEQLNKPEYRAQVHWEVGTVALWDNRAMVHYSPNDLRHLGHQPHERIAYHVALHGEVPMGVDGRPSVALRGGEVRS